MKNYFWLHDTMSDEFRLMPFDVGMNMYSDHSIITDCSNFPLKQEINKFLMKIRNDPGSSKKFLR